MEKTSVITATAEDAHVAGSKPLPSAAAEPVKSPMHPALACHDCAEEQPSL